MIINLILNYFLLISYGIIGAVVATLITEFVVMMLGMYKIQQLKRINI
jgi:O-antigen/teichoic acid export membrane protein